MKMAEMIDKLPDKYKSVVYQRYVLEMSMEDIGRANNIPSTPSNPAYIAAKTL